jgi:curved DNA-binding protein CbpA
MRNSIPPRFKLLYALQVLLVAAMVLCATGKDSFAKAAASDEAIDHLSATQKAACDTQMQEAMQSLPDTCTNDLKITAATLSTYSDALNGIGYESAFCGSPKAKLSIASAPALFQGICGEGKGTNCQSTLNGLAEEKKPLASFSCGLTRLYHNPAYLTAFGLSKVKPGNPLKPPPLFVNKLNEAVSAAQANNAKTGDQSATLAEIQATFSPICFACGIVTRLYVTSIVYGEAVTKAIGHQVVKLLGIGLALYMVFVAAKIFMPFGPQDKVIGLANKLSFSFMVTVALSFLLLTDTSYKFFWNYIYNPIVDAAINMNSELLNEGSGDGTFFAKLDAQNIVCKTLTAVDASVLTADQIASKNKLECQVHKMQYVFTYGLATGIYILLKGAWVSGIILIVIYALAPLMFAYPIVDALMRWTFMSVLSPVLMACGCFPLTRKYAFLGGRVMLEAAISFVVVAVIAVLMIGTMEQSLLALNDKLGEKNLPAWLENTVKIPETTSPVTVPTIPSITPPTTLPDTPVTTGQLEQGTINVASNGGVDDHADHDDHDEEPDYATTLLSGMVDKNTVGFPPQYPQQTTLTTGYLQQTYEDRALSGTMNLSTGVCTGRTGKYISMVPAGGDFYTLRLIENGVVKGSVTVVSGKPGLKPVERSADFSGSKRPVPQGIIRIGSVDRNNTGNFAGVGKTWIPFSDADTSPRAAVGFHVDNDRGTAPGTAGCVAAIDRAGIETIASWVDGGAKTLIVDHGLTENKPSCSGGSAAGVVGAASGGAFSCKVRPTSGVETSQYGWRWGRMHSGLDIANARKTAIVATDAGTVISAQNICSYESSGPGGGCNGGAGNMVVIRHAGGWMTRYLHLFYNSISVKQGDVVTAGQLIAGMGNTGGGTGTHLHFETITPSRKKINPKICLSGAAMPTEVYSGSTIDDTATAYLLNAPEYDYADEDFVTLCAAGLLAAFLLKNFANIGAQFLGGQSFGVSSSGAFSGMAGAAAQWAGALGGVGLGFARNALTPNTVNNATGNPLRDMLMQNSLTRMIDSKLEESGAYNRASEFIDGAKTTLESNAVVKGATDKLDALKTALEDFSQTRAGRVADTTLSGAAVVTGVGLRMTGVAATGVVSLVENAAMQQAMRVLEATGYGELAGAIGGGLADGIGTGMSWVPEDRTVFINRDVVKQYVSMQDLMRDAQDRVVSSTEQLKNIQDKNSTDYIADAALRATTQDRLAKDVLQATLELKLLQTAAKFDVTGRYNIALQEMIKAARGDISGYNREGMQAFGIEMAAKNNALEKMLKRDADNVRYTPQIEQAIIEASMRGFSSKKPPTVAGYTQTSDNANTSGLATTNDTGLSSQEARSTSQRADDKRQAAFATLGLKEGATEAEIKQARKDILRDVARDVTLAGNAARLEAVNEAYDLLSQARREKLDSNKSNRDAAGNDIQKPVAGYARTDSFMLAPAPISAKDTARTTPQAAAKEAELRGLQKVAGYKDSATANRKRETSAAQEYGSNMINNTGGGGDDRENSVGDYISERRKFFEQEERTTGGSEANAIRSFRRNLQKAKNPQAKNEKSANKIVGFVRSKKDKDRDLVAAGRKSGFSRDANDDNNGDT